MSEHLPARYEPPRSPGPAYNYGAADDPATLSSGFNAQRFLQFLLRFWWVPILTITLAVAAAVIYVRRMPPVFVSTARMWETEKMRLPQAGTFTEGFDNYLGTQIELLQSDKLRELALQRLRGEATNAIPLDSRGRPVKVRIQVTQVPKTTVLEAHASCFDPAYTRAYLNAVMETYLEYKKSLRKDVSGDALASISEQAARLEKELKVNEEALTTFQRTNNLAILEEEGRIAGGYLARLKTQLSDLDLEAQLLNATAQDLNAKGDTNSSRFPLGSMAGAGSSSISPAAPDRQTAWKEVEMLKIQRDKLSRYLRPKHPKIVKLDADIERGQKLVDLYQKQSREELETAREAVKLKIQSVQTSIRQWERRVIEANDRIAEAERLKLNVKRTQDLYDPLRQLVQSVDLSRNVDRETLAVLDAASPALRSRRQELMLLALALFAGLSAGFGGVFLAYTRDDRFSSMAEVDEKFGDSIIGQVPEVHRPGQNGSLPLIEHEGQLDVYSESYRNLRSALLFLPTDGERPKLLLITSALPSEGKSTIASNLARSLALGGSSVLLVDGDLRKGRLHKIMGQSCEPGLADAIGRPEEADTMIRGDSLANLAFLPRGKIHGNPGDLLLRPQLEQLLRRWRERFEYVVVDSCPVFAADDVMTLAHKVDGTLLVVRRRFSRGAVVREALELLVQRQARVLGLIFNRADSSARSYHYYNYADYHETEAG